MNFPSSRLGGGFNVLRCPGSGGGRPGAGKWGSIWLEIGAGAGAHSADKTQVIPTSDSWQPFGFCQYRNLIVCVTWSFSIHEQDHGVGVSNRQPWHCNSSLFSLNGFAIAQ